MVSTHKDLRISNFAHKLKRTMAVAGEFAHDIITLRDKPGILDYASITTRLLGHVLEESANDFYDYFEDWYSLESSAISDILVKILLKLPTKQIGGHDTHAIMMSDVYGCDVGWVRHKSMSEETSDVDSNSDYSGPYIMEQSMQTSLNAIGRLLWEHLGSSHALFGTKLNVKSGMLSGKDSRIVGLYVDEEINKNIFASKRAIELTDRVQMFVKAGVNRSVLLLGPPGTGKTTIMKYCASQLGMHSLRLNVSDLEHLSAEMIVEVVDILKPECLIIDDFDRLHSTNGAYMLTQLEQLNKIVKVMLFSVNNINEIDPAVIRPGRFDEIVEILDIDKEVVEKLIDATLPEKIRKQLLQWPVAYINEFAKRKNVLGLDQALAEVSELKYRIEKINNRNYENTLYQYDNEDDVE